MCHRCEQLAEDIAHVIYDAGRADDLEDAITKAKRRLECYYQCVTREPDIFEEDDKTFNFWEPPL